MNRIIALALIPMIVALPGCALFNWRSTKPIEIQQKAVERVPLRLSDPAPLKPSTPRWHVITPATAAQVWAELQAQNTDLVLFALTDDGYEELSRDYALIRNFIAQQREIIIRYRQYYEAPPAEK